MDPKDKSDFEARDPHHVGMKDPLSSLEADPPASVAKSHHMDMTRVVGWSNLAGEGSTGMLSNGGLIVTFGILQRIL